MGFNVALSAVEKSNGFVRVSGYLKVSGYFAKLI